MRALHIWDDICSIFRLDIDVPGRGWPRPAPSVNRGAAAILHAHTGMALIYNVGIMAFGGFAPIAFTSLIALTGSGVAPSFYLVAMAFVSTLSLMILWWKLGFR